MKHQLMATANATAVTTAIVYIVCRLAFLVAPELSLSITRSWFHGIDIGQLSIPNIASETFFPGLITATVGAWLVGYLFAISYDMFVKK